MRIVSFILLLVIGIFHNVHANTNRYRLTLGNDPSTTITIGWNQVSGSSPIVYYDTTDHGTNYASYSFSRTVDRSVFSKGMSNQFVRLTGLTPNTSYYFVIKDSESTSQRFWFKTAPADNSKLFFIAGGDSRNNRTPRQRANLLVSKLKPHAVLFGGDMTDDDTNTEWQQWFDDWQLTIASDGRMFPIIAARGNHEDDANVVYNLFDTPNANSYYAITWGINLIRTYTLNTEISVLGDQLVWLNNDLASSSNLKWKMAQYHKPMRPHTFSKSEGDYVYNAWAQSFYDNQVRLVVECDSHMSKTTWPIKPSSETGNDEGFVIDQVNGTVYTGEGTWGAPLRSNDDDKGWTRNSGTFNQFKLIFVEEDKIELRTVNVDNADSVAEGSNTDPFQLPANLDIFSPSNGGVVTIANEVDGSYCPNSGASCDDLDPNTSYDVIDESCNCSGIESTSLTVQSVEVSANSDDAEQNVVSGAMDLYSSDLELITDGSEQLVGIRFNNVVIPDNVVLYRAYIQFQTDESTTDATNLTIHGELSTSSNTFNTAPNNIFIRTKTTNSVSWNDIPVWGVGKAQFHQRTPNLKSIVDEITTQAGWVSGNPVTFIISGTGRRVAESFESGQGKPVLQLFFKCDDAGTVCNDGNANTILDIIDDECICNGTLKSQTLNYQVSKSSDDAEQAESGGNVYATSSDLELVFDSFQSQNNQTVGIRFNDIQLPKTAVITSAHIQFTSEAADSGATSVTIRGEKAANSSEFLNENFNLTNNRPVTTASVLWPSIPTWGSAGLAGANQKTPDLKTIVQEIVDLPDWQLSNSISFIITGSGRRQAESYDGNPSLAARLTIVYEIQENTWTGSTNSDWNNTSNWSRGVIPTDKDVVYINSSTNMPVINGTYSIGNLVIESGETLTVNGALTINDKLINQGSLILNSGSSLIVKDSPVEALITYKRTLGTTNWYLIASPVSDQDIDAFASAGNLATGGTSIGLSNYNNATNSWQFYQSGSSGSGNFTLGEGRAIKLAAPGDITFTGTTSTTDIGIATTLNSNGYNLIGNPYPSYISINAGADNILSANNDILEEQTFWFWNQAISDYDPINMVSSTQYLAPVQGFFINGDINGTFSFTEAMQSHQSDSFQRNSTTRPEIRLELTDGALTRRTDIYYFDGATTDFDNGYDSSIFNGSSNEFKIYTRTVTNSMENNLGIQSLPNNNFENMVIPIGISANSGVAITISATSINLPEGIDLYLEDKNDDTFTLLDSASNFTTTISNNLNGIGRFYLHTKSQILNVDEVESNPINMYYSGNYNLKVMGIEGEDAEISVYNIQGKQVYISSFTGTGINEIELPKVKTGIYIIQLETEKRKQKKKIIIN